MSAEVRCSDCEGNGWLHMEDSMGRGPGIERCDTCEQYEGDEEAGKAHALACQCNQQVHWQSRTLRETVFLFASSSDAWAFFLKVRNNTNVLVGYPSLSAPYLVRVAAPAEMEVTRLGLLVE